MITTPPKTSHQKSKPPSTTSPLFVSRSTTDDDNSSRNGCGITLSSLSSSSSSSSNNKNDPYYSNKTFTRFFPFAGIYTILAHLIIFLFKPIPLFILRDMVTVNQLHPEDRFVLSSSKTKKNHHHHHHHNVAIVTGSNTGIGFETASSLVEMGYDVILACRSQEKGLEAVNRINNNMSSSNNNKNKKNNNEGKAIFIHPLDLSSLESVKSFVNVFKRKYNHLNILINNAGINTTGKSVDGLDLCFQTNFIGHYLLTRLLMSHLLCAKNYFSSCNSNNNNNDHNIDDNIIIDEKSMESGRVVNLSSVTHHFANAREKRTDGVQTHGIHDEQWWRGCAEPNISNNTYKESKMAALLLTQELNRRFGSQGLRAISVNPGSVNSDIWRNYPSYMMKVHDKIYLTSKEGSSTSIAAAVGKLPKEATYLQPYWQPWGKRRIEGRGSMSFRNWYSLPIPFTEMLGVYIGYAVTDCRLPHPDAALAMWNVCEDLVGLKKDKSM